MAPATDTNTEPEPEPEPENVPDQPPLDLDAMARRLIEPVARLLRTELRRGRERAGRPHDGRR
jgi:syndecan 1